MNPENLKTVKVTRQPGRLEVQLNRPQVRNAFDEHMIRELTAVFGQAGQDPSLRCLVLSGEGPVFCAGADLHWMRRAASWSREENRADALRLGQLLRALEDLPCATVALVRGAALGGGAGLVACVDIALAEEDARFGFTEVRLGIIPSVISPFVLRRISVAAARRYFQTGELLDGRRAAALGLISEALPPSALAARGEEVVAHLMAAGPEARREAKRLVRLVSGSPDPEMLETTAELIAELRGTGEAREGMAAFLEKRPPSWREESP